MHFSLSDFMSIINVVLSLPKKAQYYYYLVISNLSYYYISFKYSLPHMIILFNKHGNIIKQAAIFNLYPGNCMLIFFLFKITSAIIL